MQKNKNPWFNAPKPRKTKRHAVIIGAGIAGITTAWALVARGWKIDLIEAETTIARGASGNTQGLLMPRLSTNNSADGLFYAAAYRQTLRTLHILQQKDPGFDWQQSGVLQLACTARIRQQIEKLDADPDFVQKRSSAQASQLAGIEIPMAALYFPKAGSLNPKALCQYLLEDAGDGIQLHLNTSIQELRLKEEGWQLFDQHKAPICTSENVILANAINVTQLSQTAHFPLSPARGQLTVIPVTAQSQKLKMPLCYEGYLLPENEGRHIIGATFKRGDTGTEIRASEHQENLDQLQKCLPELIKIEKEGIEKLKGRAAIRALSPDRLPLVGPAPDLDFFEKHYHDLYQGKYAGNYPDAQYHPGLYINVGHGSRGLCSAFLSAEIIAAQLNNEPSPVQEKIRLALLPARFIVRDLKRGKVGSIVVLAQVFSPSFS